MSVLPVTPRRSTRGTIFTPSPSVALVLSQPNTTFAWTSAPHPSPSASTKVRYNSFTRIVSHTGQTPRKPLQPGKRPKARKGDDESRFAVGDGVEVKVEGGNEGVGILVGLWEEPEPDEVDEDDEEVARENEDKDVTMDGNDGAEGGRTGEGGEHRKSRMMAEVHWCFRRQDLPSIMKNLAVADNEVLLAASPIRPVTTSIPVQLLVKTVPIYSRAFFKQQFEPTKSVVKGWTYIRQGVYWCSRAYDKGAKGGKVWKVDIDGWREGGGQGDGWSVPMDVVADSSDEEADESSDEDADSGSEAGGSEDEEEEDEGEELGTAEDGATAEAGLKRKRGRPKKADLPKRGRGRPKKGTEVKRPRGRPKGAIGAATSGGRRKKVPHPNLAATTIPSSVPALEDLPADPYERALRLLHVGATPESLPCREEEFVDVLLKVEEGVESGGGGCLYIAGVPGTGKTATVHAVVKELKRKAEDGELPPFSYVEINGLKIPSPQHAYVVLWEAISGAKGASSKTALRGLEAHFGRKTGGARGPRGHTFVVLMDELDQLLTAKQDVVYNFFNWPTMRDSQLFVIAVANRMDLPQHLAAKIKSRLGLQTILFQPYDRQNLIDIVQSRLVPHPKSQADHKVLMPDAIALAATKMAGTNGDARRVLDACRRAVEVSLEARPGMDKAAPHPVTAREMMLVLNLMSSSPVSMFLRGCSLQQKMMLAAVVRCVRREGVPEIPWRSVRTDHDALTRSLADSNDLLSNAELALVFTSLLATHALVQAWNAHQALEDRKVALGMEIGEVGRVLMNEGEAWRRALAGT